MDVVRRSIWAYDPNEGPVSLSWFEIAAVYQDCCVPRPQEFGMPRQLRRGKEAVCRIALIVALVGCTTRSAGQPEIAPVSGTVTMDGRPLVGVAVVFESERGVLSFGNTDDEGRYSVSYIRSAKGAGLGRNVVRIRTPTMGPSSPLRKDKVPAIYNSASTLAVDVTKGRNVFDFSLESQPAEK
jgi:hypothetical protein